MLSIAVARDLHAAGLRWKPARGDQFIVSDRDMDDEVFVLSDMTIEVHEFPSGPVIGFNGTTEWALDSLEQEDALWVPAEHQLRDLLGGRFRRLERDGAGFVVVVELDGAPVRAEGETAADAYGRALLALLGSLAT